MHDLWISGGQFECENAGGFLNTGLLTSSMPAAAPDKSSHSALSGNGGNGPWIRQLPPNLAWSARLEIKKNILNIILNWKMNIIVNIYLEGDRSSFDIGRLGNLLGVKCSSLSSWLDWWYG